MKSTAGAKDLRKRRSGASAVSDIASDNQAQPGAVTEINSAVSSMERATQQNAAMIDQSSAAARNLAGEVARLNGKISQFTTGVASAGAAHAGARSGERRFLKVA